MSTDDPADHELIQRLCLEAGRIMEDASAELASCLPDEPKLAAAHVARLQRAAQDLCAVASAAAALLRREGDSA